jgi:hypothetical protein
VEVRRLTAVAEVNLLTGTAGNLHTVVASLQMAAVAGSRLMAEVGNPRTEAVTTTTTTVIMMTVITMTTITMTMTIITMTTDGTSTRWRLVWRSE